MILAGIFRNSFQRLVVVGSTHDRFFYLCLDVAIARCLRRIAVWDSVTCRGSSTVVQSDAFCSIK